MYTRLASSSKDPKSVGSLEEFCEFPDVYGKLFSVLVQPLKGRSAASYV